jgi:3-hydroxyacyl-CoA dehydrogenase/enoyl-CoA hydratase/3-hydroxybutyryl-CoA epimerase
MPESAVYVLEKMAHGYRRMGRAAGAGFYDYSTEPAQLWSGLKTFERGRRKIPAEDVRDRLVFAATLCALSVDHAADRAFGETFGAAVPGNATAAQKSALLADGQQFIRRSRDLATRYGPRFEPSQQILDALDRPAG